VEISITLMYMLTIPCLCFLDGIELIIMIVATFGQAVSGNGHAVHIIGVLVVWRFMVSFLDCPSLLRAYDEPLRWALASVVTTLLVLSSLPNLPLRGSVGG
jgi:hypothetical protein